jgi:hypothetical protein
MLGSNWLWNRVDYRWMVSSQAACLYGLAAIFISLLTAYWFGVITPSDSTSLIQQILWGALGILSPLSIIFLWTGMRKYQQFREIRNPELIGKSTLIRLLLSVGIWYGAMIYFLLIYLPARRRSQTESIGGHVW